jgi:hypothetical protein
MRDNEKEKEKAALTWVPAPEWEATRARRARAVGAVMLASACASIGFLIGRVSTQLPPAAQHQTGLGKRTAETPKQAGAVASELARRAAVQASPPPTLALTSDPDPETKAATPPVVLLNPGSADDPARKPREIGKGRAQSAQEGKGVTTNPFTDRPPEAGEKRSPNEAARQRRPSEREARQADDNQRPNSPNSEADYRSLRDYMLSR